MVDDLRAVSQDGVQLVERVERVFVALETLVAQAYNNSANVTMRVANANYNTWRIFHSESHTDKITNAAKRVQCAG